MGERSEEFEARGSDYLLRYGAPVFLLASWSHESAITWWMLGRLLGSGSRSFFRRQMAAETEKKT